MLFDKLSEPHQTYFALHEDFRSRLRCLPVQDVSFRKYILDISCRSKTIFIEQDLPLLREYTFPLLAELEDDGLIKWNEQGVNLTREGHYFIRNICSAFDLQMLRSQNDRVKQFSKAV